MHRLPITDGLPSQWLISLVVYVYKKLWNELMSLKLNLINTTKQTFILPVHNLNGPPSSPLSQTLALGWNLEWLRRLLIVL